MFSYFLQKGEGIFFLVLFIEIVPSRIMKVMEIIIRKQKIQKNKDNILKN